MKIDSWVLEMLLLIFFVLIYRESRIVLGKERANIFLWGSIIWTGIIENVGVSIGGYDYFGYADSYSFGGRIIEGYAGYPGIRRGSGYEDIAADPIIVTAGYGDVGVVVPVFRAEGAGAALAAEDRHAAQLLEGYPFCPQSLQLLRCYVRDHSPLVGRSDVRAAQISEIERAGVEDAHSEEVRFAAVRS